METSMRNAVHNILAFVIHYMRCTFASLFSGGRNSVTKRRITLSIVVVSIALIPITAAGWGEKGHEMSARVAARMLPKDMPPFFRDAVEKLAYLCPEPDRWRTSSTQALNDVNAPDHYFDLEAWGADPLPASRYDLVVLSIRKGIVHYDPLTAQHRRGMPGGDKFVSDVGTAPYAIAENAAKLISNFRDWRDAADGTHAERLVKNQIEDNIIYIAGVLAHYVTDLGNPLHCTVHFNGWAEGYPNPKKFAVGQQANGIHARFETDYVNSAIEEKDIEPLISPPRRLKSWVPDMEAFIRRNNGFVEQLYTLDKNGPFGSGSESPGAKPFVAARLADAASMLRDVWDTAWVTSEEEWLNERVMVLSKPGKTVLQLLRERHRVETADRGGKVEVVGIGNRRNGIDHRIWQLYVNNAPAGSSHSVDTYSPAPSEHVDFRFEKPAAAK